MGKCVKVQESKILDIPWEEPSEIQEGEEVITIPQIEGQIIRWKATKFLSGERKLVQMQH